MAVLDDFGHGFGWDSTMVRDMQLKIERSRRWCAALVHVLIFALGVCQSRAVATEANPSADEARLLAGLHQRRLYRLAEVYCRDRLDAADLDVARRAELTVELARALAGRAAELPLEQSDEAWRRATALTADFITQHPRHLRLLVVEVQSAQTRLDRAELSRDRLSAGAEAADGRQPLRAELQSIVEQLQLLRTKAEQQLSAAPQIQLDRQQMTVGEVQAVIQLIDRQLARALHIHASCFAPGSVENVAGLKQAVEILRELTKGEIGDETRIELVACWRELENFGPAAQLLDEIERAKPAPMTALQARAERVRLALAERKPQGALALLATGRSLDGQLSPELDAAFLQTYLVLVAELRQQQQLAEAGEYQRRAEAVLAEIERAHGVNWARRAEFFVQQGSMHVGPAAGVQVVVSEAQRLHTAGKIDESLTTYDRAAAECLQQGDQRRAFDLHFAAATIEHRRQNFAAASRRYREAALRLPTAPRAAEAHLLAAHDALEAAKLVKPLSTAHYRELLTEHLQQWSDSPTTGEAHWRLARLETLDRHWSEALAAYRAIKPGDRRYANSIEGAADVYVRWFGERRAAGDVPTADAIAAAGEFEAMMPAASTLTAEPFNEASRAAALAAARMWLESGLGHYEQAEKLLQRALADLAGDAAGRRRLLPLLIVAQVGQAKVAVAQEHLRELADPTALELLTILEPLAALCITVSPPRNTEMAALGMQALELMADRGQELPAEAQQRLRRAEARVRGVAGEREQAQAAYDQLIRVSPRDAVLREEVAEFLTRGTDHQSYTAALAAWRDLERHVAAGSPRWFQAKLGQARVHLQAGESAQAAQVISLLRVLHPDLGGEAMREKFLRLEAEIVAKR